ncbi:hypothetical protein IFM89_034512 [Coptis chinensis]|uniref:Hydroxyproline-rich glycoprotein family protein n=1 Tax=Coptis chinensis TaxID=261450 RepID=A0A835HPL0_9MAGN|nr:hypothetical protein IFM89_034512 [Coptis chinensis]
MADSDAYSHQLEVAPQRLVSGNETNPSKFNSHFLYKALSVAIVLVILPLFPSQAPEFINQTMFTRTWELLHLLFVGVAVSYGLFSRRNVEETEKENQLKVDTTQTYMSRILQVSSVFDDEVETPAFSDENKAQTWNSKYFRGDPVVVVEDDNSVLDEQSSTISNVSNKPLFLPVRSLRSAVSDTDNAESFGEPVESLGSSLSRSASSTSKSSSTGTREFGDMYPIDLEENLKENVLPSPIPWRSRSGRMEMKEEVGEVNPPPYSLPRRLKTLPLISPKKEECVQGFSPPPPPPPLPTPISRTSPITKSSSRTNGVSSEKKDVTRSFTDELKDRSRSGREGFPGRRDCGIESMKSEGKYRIHSEASSMGRSVRTIRGNETITEPRKYRDFEEQRTDGKSEKRSKEVDMDKPGRSTGGFIQQMTSPQNQNHEISRPTPKPSLPKYQKKETKKLAEKVILESEEYTSSEDDHSQGGSDTEEAASDILSDAQPDPNEVDKKADEFIAKFREQIRLQRIESIKRSSGQHR